MKHKIKLALIALSISVSGCDLYRQYDQNYTRTGFLEGDANTRAVYVGYESRRAAKPGEGSLGVRVAIKGNLSDGKQVISAGKPW